MYVTVEVLVLGASRQSGDGGSFCVVISRLHSCSNKLGLCS